MSLLSQLPTIGTIPAWLLETVAQTIVKAAVQALDDPQHMTVVKRDIRDWLNRELTGRLPATALKDLMLVINALFGLDQGTAAS